MSTAVEEDLFTYKGKVWARYRATLGELTGVEAHIAEFDELLNDPQSDDLQPQELFGIVKVLVGGLDSDVIRFIEDWILEDCEGAVNATANKQHVYSFFSAALVEYASLRRKWS